MKSFIKNIKLSENLLNHRHNIGYTIEKNYFENIDEYSYILVKLSNGNYGFISTGNYDPIEFENQDKIKMELGKFLINHCTC